MRGRRRSPPSSLPCFSLRFGCLRRAATRVRHCLVLASWKGGKGGSRPNLLEWQRRRWGSEWNGRFPLLPTHPITVGATSRTRTIRGRSSEDGGGGRLASQEARVTVARRTGSDEGCCRRHSGPGTVVVNSNLRGCGSRLSARVQKPSRMAAALGHREAELGCSTSPLQPVVVDPHCWVCGCAPLESITWPGEGDASVASQLHLGFGEHRHLRADRCDDQPQAAANPERLPTGDRHSPTFFQPRRRQISHVTNPPPKVAS